MGGRRYATYAEELNDTEFGLYFVNYHSRLPIGQRAEPAALDGPPEPVMAAAQAL